MTGFDYFLVGFFSGGVFAIGMAVFIEWAIERWL
jgi:hypothetical protein